MTSKVTCLNREPPGSMLAEINSPEFLARHEKWRQRQELERQRLVALYSQNPSWIAKAEASGNPTEFWKHFYIGRVV